MDCLMIRLRLGREMGGRRGWARRGLASRASVGEGGMN